MSKQDGECIDHIGHDKCGSSDGLAVYEKPDGKIDGYCWVCQTYEPDPYKQGEGKQMSSKPKKTDAERQAELVEVYQGYAPAAIPERGITAGTAEYFGVRVARDPATQAVTHHFYPFTTKTDELVAYKQRRCADKQFVSMGFSKHPDLTMFGRYQAMRCGGKKLFVVGGEIDVLSAYQMLMQLQQGTEWANMRPAVVCARNGAFLIGFSVCDTQLEGTWYASFFLLVSFSRFFSASSTSSSAGTIVFFMNYFLPNMSLMRTTDGEVNLTLKDRSLPENSSPGNHSPILPLFVYL